MPDLFVQIKQIGKRKPVVERQPLSVPDSVGTLRDLIAWIVQDRVAAFNRKTEEANWTKYLTDIDLERVAETGKVGFDAKYNDRVQDANKAVEAAILAFQDGIFRVFLDDEEIESLEDHLNLCGGNVLTFIRLTMLSGRSW